MKPEISVRKINFKKPSKIIVIILIVLLAACIVSGWIYMKSNQANKAEIKQQTAVVKRGNLSNTVSGSGSISSSNKSDVLSNVNAAATKINLKDGDLVKAGDLIMELDDSDAQLNVKKIETSIAQTQLSQSSTLKSLDGSTVAAPISGEISALQIKNGDTVAKGAAILTITDKSKLKLLVPFNNTLRKSLHNGQTVTVNAFDTTLEAGDTVKGYISSISMPSYATSSGSEVYNVEVVVNNSGALTEGMVANAELTVNGANLTSMESGTLSYFDSVDVKSESGGTVESLNVTLGQSISKGKILAKLNNDDLILSKETSDLNIQDLQNQLEAAKKQLSYYKIYAPHDGTLSMTDIKVGDMIKSSQVVCSVADYTQMSFQIPIDELDIAKIQVGQTAKVTVDALSETTAKPLSGIVSKIAVEGTASNGVTTYPVTIQINETDKLKSGMNANAEILVTNKTNVLYVPIEAVQLRNGKGIVMLKSSGSASAAQSSADKLPTQNASSNQSTQKTRRNSSAQNAVENSTTKQNTASSTTQKYSTNSTNQKYYAGAVPTPVTIGINNEEYIEIVSGLNEGDIVILPPVSSSSQSGTQTGNNQKGITGGMALPISGGGGANRFVSGRPD